MFKKILFILTALSILAIDWAALHDILKGEPNPWQEYFVLILSLILLTIVGIRLKSRNVQSY